MPEETEGKTPEVEETDSDTFDREYVEGLRSEAASYRTKLRDTEKRVEALSSKLSEYEDSQKSELERLTDEKAKLEREIIDRDRQIAETAIMANVQVEAAGMGLRDPDAAFKLVDMSSISYEDGKVTGTKKALEKLIKDKPYLIEEETPPPSPGTGGEPIGSADSKNIDAQFLNWMKGGRK